MVSIFIKIEISSLNQVYSLFNIYYWCCLMSYSDFELTFEPELKSSLRPEMSGIKCSVDGCGCDATIKLHSICPFHKELLEHLNLKCFENKYMGCCMLSGCSKELLTTFNMGFYCRKHGIKIHDLLYLNQMDRNYINRGVPPKLNFDEEIDDYGYM